MAKYKILIGFYGKDNGIKHIVNEIHEFSDERAQEILDKGNFIELVKKKTVTKVKKEEETEK